MVDILVRPLDTFTEVQLMYTLVKIVALVSRIVLKLVPMHQTLPLKTIPAYMKIHASAGGTVRRSGQA